MSKFDKLFEARDEVAQEAPVSVPKKTRNKMPSVKSKKPSPSLPGASSNSESDSTMESATAIAASQAVNKQRGRPKAKRSNPDFIGFTTYIRKDTHLKVKILLLQEGGGREMSELVEELLSSWVKKR